MARFPQTSLRDAVNMLPKHKMLIKNTGLICIFMPRFWIPWKRHLISSVALLIAIWCSAEVNYNPVIWCHEGLTVQRSGTTSSSPPWLHSPWAHSSFLPWTAHQAAIFPFHHLHLSLPVSCSSMTPDWGVQDLFLGHVHSFQPDNMKKFSAGRGHP